MTNGSNPLKRAYWALQGPIAREASFWPSVAVRDGCQTAKSYKTKTPSLLATLYHHFSSPDHLYSTSSLPTPFFNLWKPLETIEGQP
ncbi:hypothetical protein E3N88_39999 [Mikania micrantha]|uniref:Uncharacterized protein n=1 Tax=Mikania micrantha TaxID=192012 RepID=A0A5N6LLE9_9ASTR|nr:hypothetical protein E3N88_39999 [Mikania micrantha]